MDLLQHLRYHLRLNHLVELTAPPLDLQRQKPAGELTPRTYDSSLKLDGIRARKKIYKKITSVRAPGLRARQSVGLLGAGRPSKLQSH